MEVRRLFRSALPLGRRLELQYADIVNYERQCLDWYLTRARGSARVAEMDGRIVGYVLPCLDRGAADRWTQRQAVRWLARAVGRFAVGRLGAQGRHFMELRLRELLEARRRRAATPAGGRALVQVATSAPHALVPLLAAADELVTAAGLPGWSYELHLREPVALEHLEDGDQSVDDVVLDRVLSWLAATAVLRVTVTRKVGPASR